MTTPRRTAPRRAVPHRRKRRFNWQAVVGVLLIGAAAYSAGTTYHLGEVAQERGECQARVNAAFLTALLQRDEANRALTDAQRDLIRAPARDDDARARAAANRRYLQALDDQARARNENPLPEVKPC